MPPLTEHIVLRDLDIPDIGNFDVYLKHGGYEALRAAIGRALASGGPAVIHVDVDPVRHMWAPGLMHFKKMHEEPKG